MSFHGALSGVTWPSLMIARQRKLSLLAAGIDIAGCGRRSADRHHVRARTGQISSMAELLLPARTDQARSRDSSREGLCPGSTPSAYDCLVAKHMGYTGPRMSPAIRAALMKPSWRPAAGGSSRSALIWKFAALKKPGPDRGPCSLLDVCNQAALWSENFRLPTHLPSDLPLTA